MSDFFHYFGEDLRCDENGALREASDALLTRQSVLRRLCTNPRAYLWHLTYGAGLPSRIGMPIAEDETRGLIVRQLALEAGIDQDQPVTVVLTPQAPGMYLCTISYTGSDMSGSQTVIFNQDGTI